MASRFSASTRVGGGKVLDLAGAGLGAGLLAAVAGLRVRGAVAVVALAATGEVAMGAGAGVAAEALPVLAAGTGRVAAFPEVAAGRAGVLRTGAGLLAAGVVLTSWAEVGAGVGIAGVLGVTGTAAVFRVVVFLVTILLSSAMVDQCPLLYICSHFMGIARIRALRGTR